MSQLVKHKAPKGKKELSRVEAMTDEELSTLVNKTPAKDILLLVLQILRDTKKS